MKRIHNLINKLQRSIIWIQYYLYYAKLKDKYKEILKYTEKDFNLTKDEQEEQAMPGFEKYKKNNYYQIMFGRYLLSIPYIRNKNVLDCGSGWGWGTYLISSYSSQITGVDINKEAINFAKDTWQAHNLKFVEDSALELKTQKEDFDTILAFEFIEHLTVEKGNKFFSIISNLLASGGYLILSSWFPTSRLKASIEEINNKFHHHIYTQNEIKSILNHNGFKSIRVIANLIVIAQKA